MILKLRAELPIQQIKVNAKRGNNNLDTAGLMGIIGMLL